MYSNVNPKFVASARIDRRRTLALASVLVLGISTATIADSTSPGKNSAFESATAVPLTGFAPQLTATIEKGKKKTVLAIEATYTDGPYSPTPTTARVLGLGLAVNGIGVQPNPGGGFTAVVDCGFTDTPLAACTTTYTWWLDIDAAEAANPGLFVGQPLSITMLAGDLMNGSLVGVQPMDASLTVRVQKK